MVIEALSNVLPGRYAIAVSGGADSVCLLHALHHHRRDVELHVVHLDHQTRGEESTADARFVADLARGWGLPCTVRRLEELADGAGPANKSARFRAARLKLYAQAIGEHGLEGVLLAHHRDDQAETVMHRLLRGAHAPNLGGMSVDVRVQGVRLLRPLLGVPREALRAYLRSVGQVWREDVSNASMDYFRNRIRRLLSAHPELTDALVDLHASLSVLRNWVQMAAPILADSFPARRLLDLPSILAEESARAWLVRQGCPPDALGPGSIAALLEMVRDAAAPARCQFPGRVTVRRRGGRIDAERA